MFLYFPLKNTEIELMGRYYQFLGHSWQTQLSPFAIVFILKLDFMVAFSYGNINIVRASSISFLIRANVNKKKIPDLFFLLE